MAPASVPSRVTVVSSARARIPSSTRASRLHRAASGFSAASCFLRRTISSVPPTTKAAIQIRNIQPMGDWLKACRLLKIPLRVRNVAKLHSPKVAIARNNVVFFSAPCRQVISPWINAVPVSQGIREPFSTGSQAQ